MRTVLVKLEELCESQFFGWLVGFETELIYINKLCGRAHDVLLKVHCERAHSGKKVHPLVQLEVQSIEGTSKIFSCGPKIGTL